MVSVHAMEHCEVFGKGVPERKIRGFVMRFIRILYLHSRQHCFNLFLTT